MDLEELIKRGRFIFSKAPERLVLYNRIDGRSNAKELAKRTRRHVNNVHRDLRLLANAGLIEKKTNRNGESVLRDGLPVYDRVALAKTIPATYFTGVSRIVGQRRSPSANQKATPRLKKPKPLPVPTEQEVLDICRDGEDQLYEFKAAGTEVRKITREIGAMLNTRQGGMVLYGVDDQGTIQGSDITRQQMDQSLQNSIKNTISPAANISLKSISVMGNVVLVVIVPPWNRKDVYQVDGRVTIRKGTNVFTPTPDELRKLHKGQYVI